MGILLGALAGGARAYDEIANDHLAAAAAWNKHLIDQQDELNKEARIEEARQAAEARGELRAERTSAREYAMKKQAAQDELAMQTDPKNVEAVAKAKAQGESILDRSRWANVNEEAAYKRKLALAGHIDNTDYEGRRLEHELRKAQIESARGGGEAGALMSKAEKERYDLLSRDRKDALDMYNSENATEGQKKQALDRYNQRTQELDTLMGYETPEKPAASTDPNGIWAEIKAQPATQGDDREALLTELRNRVKDLPLDDQFYPGDNMSLYQIKKKLSEIKGPVKTRQQRSGPGAHTR
jgi:hypothetical protein